MHLFELRAANRARQAEWPGNDQIDKSFRTIEVAGEGGEIVEALTGLLVTAIHGLGIASGSGKVAERVKKLLRAERGITGSTATLDHLADELADGAVTIDLLAEDLGIDLDAAVARKFNATSEKYGLKTRITQRADEFGHDVDAILRAMIDREVLQCEYKNWRGEVGLRTFRPQQIWCGSTKFHPELGLFLTAFDVDKNAMRDFRLADFNFATLQAA